MKKSAKSLDWDQRGQFWCLANDRKPHGLANLDPRTAAFRFSAGCGILAGVPKRANNLCIPRRTRLAGSAGAACFPMGAVLVEPGRGPAPDGYAQRRPCDSSAQTALGSANEGFPTTAPVCKSDTHAPARSAERIPNQPE